MAGKDRDDLAVEKAARRNAAAIEACVGIATETLEKIAALPVSERPSAMADAAAKQAKKAAR